MNVVDSSAWLSWISDDQNAQHFSTPILDVENLLVPTVTLTEVFKAMVRQTNESMAMQAVTQMKLGKIVHLDSELALEAAVCGLKLKLPLADSIIYATARKHGAIVWTQHANFKDLPAVRYYPQ